MTDTEKKLIEQGWQRRFIASEPRLSEMVTMYEESGFEVHLESITAVGNYDESNENCHNCTICFEGTKDQYSVIFTRRKSGDE